MRFMRQAATIGVVAAITGCTSFTPATLPGPDDYDGTIGLLQRVLGVEPRVEIVREFVSPEQVAASLAASPARRSPGDDVEFERSLWLMLRPPERVAAVAALARSFPESIETAYDLDAQRVVAVPRVADSPIPTRRADVLRVHAYALALLDRELNLAERFSRPRITRDEIEALCAFADGTAYVATLAATHDPIAVVDVATPALVERHEQIAELLLADPDGGATRLLADPDLPDVTRFALEEIVDAEDQDRARRALRRFLGARFALEAMQRLSAANFAMVLRDPPVSTEQLLHPEFYFDRDDPPAAVVKARRGGLLGPGQRLLGSGVVGELGVRQVLEPIVGTRRAAAAADGWNADWLSMHAGDGGEVAYAWRLEFEQRFDADEFAVEIQAALRERHGGRFVEIEDGAFLLQDGGVPAFVERRIARVSVVVGGSATRLRAASTALLDELVEEVDPDAVASAGRQDFAFRWSRILASPLFFDQPGRFDTLVRSFYGLLFSHRAYPSGALHETLNPDCFPVLGSLLPPGSSAALMRLETGPARGRFDLFGGLLFSRYRNRSLDGVRYASPLVCYSATPEHRAWRVLGGSLFAMADGAGHSEFSPRLLYSRSTALNGAERSTGVVLDAVRWSSREGRDRTLELLPFGLLASLRRDVGVGFDFDVLAGLLRWERREVVPDAPHRRVDVGYGWLFQHRSDAAAVWSSTDVLAGLLFHRHAALAESETGVFRIGSRSLFATGNEGPHRYRDVFFWRFELDDAAGE